MFCTVCFDWLKDKNWQADGRYFCDTCLEFRAVDLIWKPDECLVHDTTENFS